MSIIQSLKLEVKDLITKENRSCLIISRETARGTYNVIWLITGGRVSGVLMSSGFLPLNLEISNGPKYHKIDLKNKTFRQAWNRVHVFVVRMESFVRVDEDLTDLSGKDRYCERVRGCKTFHPAMHDVVAKYYAWNNATLIYPGNWIDKKLTEAYNSRRVKNNPEDTKEDEQTAAS